MSFAPRSHVRALLVAGLAAGGIMLGTPGSDAQPASAPLVLEAAIVRPDVAAPDTLCHLEARIRNAGRATASSFAFRLKLDDHDIGAYRDHLFLDPIEPGAMRVLPLFSFWANESGRALPLFLSACLAAFELGPRLRVHALQAMRIGLLLQGLGIGRLYSRPDIGRSCRHGLRFANQ